MRDVMVIENADQAGALLHPLRLALLRRVDEPKTCNELAQALGKTPQQIYYHVKVLERAGVLEKVEERRVRAVPEGHYSAAARSYWLSPNLVGQIGSRPTRDPMSMGVLLSVAEELQSDIGQLAKREREEIPSMAFSAQVRLARPAERTAFLSDIQNAIQTIAKKYGATGPQRPSSREAETFRLIFACYPRPEAL